MNINGANISRMEDFQELVRQSMGKEAENYVEQMIKIIYDIYGELDDIYDEV